MNTSLSAAPVSSSDWQKLPPHPRLLANEEKWLSLKLQIRSDSISADLFKLVKIQADSLLDLPVVAYEKEGRRLLGPARQCVGRVLCLAMTYRLTGEDRCAERAIAELRAAAAVPDWNPSHYLDTAELTLALALGYDWLFDQLTEADRGLVREAMVQKGLRPSVDPAQAGLWWIKGKNNWNQVCHAGMVAGALAIAPDEPELGLEMVNRALENLPAAAHTYAPDGAYMEGPMYWTYGTTFHVILTESLRGALGSTFGTEKYPGFLESADFLNQVTGPSGDYFNYADGKLTRSFQSADFWFARERRQPSIAKPDLALLPELPDAVRAFASSYYSPHYLLPLALLWWQPGDSESAAPQPLDWVGRGDNPVAAHRSAWNDPQAAFLAIKGGRASSNHAHMDAGSFVFESDGIRWAVDLGMQDYYSLESKGLKLWAADADTDRWRIFRLGPESHNILRFNGANPAFDGFATLVSSHDSQTLVDLSAVYPDVARVFRGVRLQPDRTLWIQDEWKTRDQPMEATFQWLTFAAVSVAGSMITLKQDGQSLTLRVLEPKESVIQVEDVSQPRADYDAPNPGLSRISIRVSTPAQTAGRLAILATPGGKSATAISPVLPLESWNWDRK